MNHGMNTTRANWVILECNDNEIVIGDVGPWEVHPTVTNDVERVIAELHAAGNLDRRRLFYFDSENNRDEIIHDGKGGFLGFTCGPRRRCNLQMYYPCHQCGGTTKPPTCRYCGFHIYNWRRKSCPPQQKQYDQQSDSTSEPDNLGSDTDSSTDDGGE